MNVIYLTTHILDEDFAAIAKEPKPNPAGQNFHGKMIRALGTSFPVHVYSLIPQILESVQEKEFTSGNLSYHYVRGNKNKYVRALFLPFSLSSRIKKEQCHQDKNVIIYDALNVTLARLAKQTAKKLKCPYLAVLTDEIHNITGVDVSYANRIHRYVRQSSGAISLTEGLLRAYELYERPHFIQPLLVEKVEVMPKTHARPYLYYGGALFEKDGTIDLLNSVNQLKSHYDLIISGHGPAEKQVKEEAEREPSIVFLGQIPKQEHYAYIAGAEACINPRHYNSGLDACAVPSKVMEYLTYGRVIISSLSTPIRQRFPKDINWIDVDWPAFLNKHGLDSLLPNKAQEKILSEYGIEATGKALSEFLLSLSA